MNYSINDIPATYKELKEILKDKHILCIIPKGKYYITVITAEDDFIIIYQDFAEVSTGISRLILDTTDIKAIKKAALDGTSKAAKVKTY